MVKKITLLKNLVQRLHFSKDYYVVGHNIFFWEKIILGWCSMFFKKSDLGYRPKKNKLLYGPI
jgi:hypothetical protein